MDKYKTDREQIEIENGGEEKVQEKSDGLVDPAEFFPKDGNGISESGTLRELLDDFEKHCLLEKKFHSGKVKCHFCSFPATERVEIDGQIFYCCKEHGMENPEETK